jgi:hypothetical protein
MTVTLTVPELEIKIENVAYACNAFASLTVALTEAFPEVVGVPEISPVEAFSVKPAGKPLAENV